jgi:hypothetical protein
MACDLLQRRQAHGPGSWLPARNLPQLSPVLRVPAIGSNAETVRPGSKWGAKPGASRRSACPPRPPCPEPKLPGTHTAGPWDTGAQRGGQLGQAMQRMPAARGHDHSPVHLRAPLRYPGQRDQRRGATGAPGLQRRAVRDHRLRGRPQGGSGYPPGQVAGPSASRRSPGSPLPPGPPDEPSAPPRPGLADGYLSPIDWRGCGKLHRHSPSLSVTPPMDENVEACLRSVRV